MESPQLTRFFLLPLECAKVFYTAGARLVLCGRNREALEELTKELAASLATKVSPGVCVPRARGAAHCRQASEEIAATWAAACAGHPRGHSVPG